MTNGYESLRSSSLFVRDRQGLPKEELNALILRTRALPPGAEREEAWEQVIAELYPWALTVARWFSLPGDICDVRDREQLACIAVYQAAMTFNPEKGAITTWLTIYVRAAIRDSLSHVGISWSQRIKHMRYAAGRSDKLLYELSADLPEDDPEYHMLSSDEEVELADLCAHVQKQVRHFLPERSADILMMRAQGYTLEEVGRHFKITRERVRQIEAYAIRKVCILLKPAWQLYLESALSSRSGRKHKRVRI